MKHPIVEILEKFENGQELYNTSSLFNKCVHALYAGVDVYTLLEQVIVVSEQQTKTMEEFIKKTPMPIMFYCKDN